MAYNNGPTITTNGLVLYLDAANIKSYAGSGTTWADLSGNGNNGTLTNGPTFNSENGGSIVFDGTNDQVIATSISLTNYTFEFFAKTTGDSLSGATGYNTLIGYGSSRRLLHQTNGTLLAQVGTGNIVSATGIATRNIWNHITFSYQSSNTTATWYVNGNAAGGSSAAAQGTWTSTIYIGSYNSNNYWMNGNMAIVKIYNRALTAQEVLQNFNATRSRFGL